MANIVKIDTIGTSKKVITVWGVPGSGKSTFATQISVLLGQNPDLKVLVLDFNTISPSLDHYFGVSKEPENITFKVKGGKKNLSNTGLGYAFDAIERGLFTPEVLMDITVKYPKHKNLNILTGNFLYNMFEMLNEKHFNIIVDAAKKVYDVIIIDTNSAFFVDATYTALKNADKVYALAEADYTSLREVNRSISYISSYVAKEKFEVVINKYTGKHLDKVTIGQVLEGLKVGQTIDYSEKYISSKVEKKPFVAGCKDKEKKVYVKIVEEIVGSK